MKGDALRAEIFDVHERRNQVPAKLVVDEDLPNVLAERSRGRRVIESKHASYALWRRSKQRMEAKKEKRQLKNTKEAFNEV